MFRLVLLLASLAALGACSPRANDTDMPGADVARPRNPFFGTWLTATAQVAPWWDQQGQAPEMNPDFQNRSIVLAPGESSGPEIIACTEPVYAVNIVRSPGLFEGNLPNPQVDASALGFSGPDITELTLDCTDNGKNVSLRFPMVDEDTILLGLDNMIYMLKRQ